MEKYNISAIAMKVVATLSLLGSLSFSITAYNRYYLPYNAEGKYFDGTVVWLQQAIISYLF
ncbi:MAG: hypothetical protein COA90_06260 [Gammaproteobacteria bacterium]|nr:MAG: hypothetical protein COA90_06260 [Gammaproteobacteria bacterium]